MRAKDASAPPEALRDGVTEAEAEEQGQAAPAPDPAEIVPVRGTARRVADNMEASLAIPTATSYRTIPVKLLEENRRIINDHRQAINQPKVSYTHLIAWALVRALREFPNLNSSYQAGDSEPVKHVKRGINLGVAVDLERRDGSRALLVPNIKSAQDLSFPEFLQAYDETIRRARTGSLAPADLQETTITLTNPGTVGTIASVPRLMTGQGAIVATGAIGYPAEYHAWSSKALSSLGFSKAMTISCTYDHRLIQGAESGQFLGKIHDLLLGNEGFYEQVFEQLNLPQAPIQWALDHHPGLLGASAGRDDLEKQAGVLKLINLYRVRGHLIANLDPLDERAHYHPELDPATYGLTLWDLDREFVTGGLGRIERGSLRQILAVLRQTYCQKIGIEYRHIQDSEEKAWIQERVEPESNRQPLPVELRRETLRRLIAAEGFERYLHTKFIGHKRFGLEGAETTIPVLARILSEAADAGVAEAVIGMAHRGRLNVLANIIGKPMPKILAEFEENADPLATQGSGDVKYHLGSAGAFRSSAGKEILVSVAPNPSHLEWVNPVAEGIARAKQERRGDRLRQHVIPVLIHGDAAFAGQGVVWETMNLSLLHGYRTGGTIHVIVNNQIGFTTTPAEARSSPYPTDLARGVQAPIFHVNGDDPDAAMRVAMLAYDYRQRFKKDVVLDIFCYRRHGHNEGDEPSYTQPLLYKKISERPSVVVRYAERLEREGAATGEEIDAWRQEARDGFERAYSESLAGDQRFQPDIPLAVSEEELREFQPTGGTKVSEGVLRDVARRLSTLPDEFRLHPKLEPFMARRLEFAEKGGDVDFAFAEALAFGTLVYEGTPVRLSGQDSARGTFSQRHLVLVDLESGEQYIPLQHISQDQAQFEVFDSALSEAAVLGYEFGYSVADPLSLVIWEAQFGDFANAAQVIIDNFMASSAVKWQQPCDLVLLLPHGMEGQGPEHSSARLERFLSLCAEENLRVCSPTTAAQYFHVLRRQMRDASRIPLVLMTPKSLLRHPATFSPEAEFTEGRFEKVLDDPGAEKSAVRRVILCGGKLYYELTAERQRGARPGAAIVRLEQFYPFPDSELSRALGTFPNAKEVWWAQEEPENMGAWRFLRRRLARMLPSRDALRYIGRPESASPATGSLRAHRREQAALIAAAFEGL
jgi:2-oxoglutarate dehydrogenase E1 component